MTTSRAEPFRIQPHGYQTNEGDNFGIFSIPSVDRKGNLKVICAPTDEEWQHVSVSRQNKCPAWEDMCLIKSMFWDKEETVIQFHPPESEYVNNHPHVLHLWARKDQSIKTPPSILVGFKGLDVEFRGSKK